MRLGMDHLGRYYGVGQLTDDKLRFLQQLGVEGVMAPSLYVAPSDKEYYDFSELLILRNRNDISQLQ